jgi:hypothetical protein
MALPLWWTADRQRPWHHNHTRQQTPHTSFCLVLGWEKEEIVCS